MQHVYISRNVYNMFTYHDLTFSYFIFRDFVRINIFLHSATYLNTQNVPPTQMITAFDFCNIFDFDGTTLNWTFFES